MLNAVLHEPTVAPQSAPADAAAARTSWLGWAALPRTGAAAGVVLALWALVHWALHAAA